MCSGSEAGSYLRLVDSCITQLKAQGPSRVCNEIKEEEKPWPRPGWVVGGLVQEFKFRSVLEVSEQLVLILEDEDRLTLKHGFSCRRDIPAASP